MTVASENHQSQKTLLWSCADFKYKAHTLGSQERECSWIGPGNNCTESLWSAGTSGGLESSPSAQRRASWGKLLRAMSSWV